MNNFGQTIFISVIVGIMLFLIGMVFLNFITPETWIDGSNSMMLELGCGTVNATGSIVGATADISDGVKATCLIGEVIVPYFIILILSTAGGIIASKFLI